MRTFFLAVALWLAASLLLAQENNKYSSANNDDDKPYSPLERDLFLEYNPLLSVRYNLLKSSKGFRFSVYGLVSAQYLANGLPNLPDMQTPIWHYNSGCGLKYFLGHFFFGWHFDWFRTTIPRPAQDTQSNEGQWLSSSANNLDLGYAAFKNDFLYVTPFLGYRRVSYAFYTPQNQRFFAGMDALGGGIDISAFFPLFSYPFTPLEERKLGIRDVIEANLSLRAGYARYFTDDVSVASAPLYQEFSLRLMLGLSMGRFVDEIDDKK